MINKTDDMIENGLSVNPNVDPTLVDDRQIFPKKNGDLNETEGKIQDSHDFMALYEDSLKSIKEGEHDTKKSPEGTAAQARNNSATIADIRDGLDCHYCAH